MPATVIVGGQFGSEGKGKTALFLAGHLGAQVVVRVGGSNAGHTAHDDNGVRHVFRHLPTAALLPHPLCVLGPGSLVDPDVLQREVDRLSLPPERLVVDPMAYVITEAHKRRERDSDIRNRIGSTLTGTGEALIDRIRRSSTADLAHKHPYLRQFVRGPVRELLRHRLRQSDRVVVEGTQGFGLSNVQSPHYPFVTSRDTTAAAFVAEAGLSPLDVDQVVLVIRAHPIRVGGNSGPLPNETDWETIAAHAGTPGLVERTTVTQRIRRVAHFDPAVVRDAIAANTPTSIVLNHADQLGSDAVVGIHRIEALIGQHVDWVGTSPRTTSTRDGALRELGNPPVLLACTSDASPTTFPNNQTDTI